MTMKLTHYIYVLLPFLLAACDSEEVIRYVYTVGEADNEIKLSAGVVESGEQAQTRALTRGTTPSYVAFTQGTKIALRVDGYWKGHGAQTDQDWVRPTRSGTLGQADGTKNPITLSSPLYWDDYGTADPNNTDGTTSGRARGLTIYGAAVNGLTSLPTGAATDGGKLTPSDIPWGGNLAWNVGTVSTGIVDQSAGWANYDLLTSNNVKDDNTYKFADRTSGKLLEFTHAMTKVTVNLTAGKGFSDNQFQTAPKVTLLGFYYTGNVTITSKTSTATTSTANINAHLTNVKTSSSTTDWTPAPTTWAASNQTQFDALVFPGNAFGNDVNILQIEADGNIYLVTAKAINDANTAENDPFEQAKNYVFDITVNKTGIEKLEATITDWVSVTAANEAPKISVVTNYGDPTTTTEGTPTISTFTKGYSFLRSENKADNSSNINKGYTDERWMKYATSAYIMYDATNGTTASPLYWPDHNTHYFFRGVYPRLGTTGDGVPVMSQVTDGSVDYDVIAVSNEKYTHTEAGHSPSDLLIAYPHEYENESDHFSNTCRHDQDVATNGICATEGKIVMNFEHAMAQVEVILQTNTDDGATNKVEFNADTKVEIIGGYKEGYILLKDGSAMFTGKSVTDYTMTRESTEGADKDKKYLDAIIPQSLVDASNKPTLKFRITVKSTNSTGDTNVDTYETVLGITEIALSDNSKITSWEHGKKYTYTLTITKTGIVAEATLKDWEEVTATQDVWF